MKSFGGYRRLLLHMSHFDEMHLIDLTVCELQGDTIKGDRFPSLKYATYLQQGST